MAATRHYDEDLRSIGQALEARGDIIDFELKRLPDLYVIRGTPDKGGSLRSSARQWLLELRNGSATDPIIFGPGDVEKLSQAGRARRSKSGQFTNFRTVSNILRTIGAYLESREVELVELHKRPITVILSYRDKAGQEHEEERTISSFYYFFLELYGKRGLMQRNGVAQE